jgi:transglutaminase superfamily protein
LASSAAAGPKFAMSSPTAYDRTVRPLQAQCLLARPGALVPPARRAALVPLAALAAACAIAVPAGCASGTASRSVVELDVDDPAARAAVLAPALDGYHAAFLLAWNGARIGEARESLHADASATGGYRFRRAERITVRREGAVATARTEILIDLDPMLSARRVAVDRWSGSTRTHGEATRLGDETWRVVFGATPERFVEGAAVPSTLVPVLVAATGVSPGRVFEAPILVEGAGLAAARLSLDVSRDRRLATAWLATAAGDLREEAHLDERGFLESAGGAVGLASRRVSEAELEARFDPPEVVEPSAVAVADAARADVSAGMRLVVRGVKTPPPFLPDLDFQHISLGPGGAWNVAVVPIDPRRVAAAPGVGGVAKALAEIRERTHHVFRVLESDLGVAALAPDEALAAGRGDCTAHAVVLAQLLGERGYQARLVTGFVLQQGALRRHRWVVVKLGRDWVAVDPTLDEVPASPAHLALAVHGPTLDELAFVDDVTFAGWDAARGELGR